DLALAQIGEFGRVIAEEPLENCARMLTQVWSTRFRSTARPGSLEGRSWNDQAVESRMVRAQDHLALLQMGVAGDFSHVRYRRARNIRGLKPLEPFGAWTCREEPGQNRIKFGMIRRPVGVGGETRVTFERTHSNCVAEALPDCLVSASGDKISICGAK